jgi:hypothetical protein
MDLDESEDAAMVRQACSLNLLHDLLQEPLGLRDRDRGEFWRFLGHVLRRHRGRFPQAIVLAAMGYHFRKLTQEVLEQTAVPTVCS